MNIIIDILAIISGLIAFAILFNSMYAGMMVICFRGIIRDAYPLMLEADYIFLPTFFFKFIGVAFFGIPHGIATIVYKKYSWLLARLIMFSVAIAFLILFLAFFPVVDWLQKYE